MRHIFFVCGIFLGSLLVLSLFSFHISWAASKGTSPLDTPMSPPLEPIPAFEKTSPAEQNRKARKRIQNSVKHMRDVIRTHRKMRGLKDPFLPR